ncbi:OmpA family protein [Arachidicoccus soli]|uniref:OmpA family protein n=2 Tax=Arachidicoccus soli TaxID=2341117 RepID=A0A386HRR9_9BACT|nr:OmpA family protein [Arachidicoccus soli]
MKMKFIKIYLLAAILLPAGTVLAQHMDSIPRVTPFSGVKDYRTWSIGFNGGGSSVSTPFSAPNDFNDIDFKNAGVVYGAYIKKQIYHGFGLQADFMRGQVMGTQKANQTPYPLNGLAGGVDKFKTAIHWSASLSGVFTLGTINWLNKQATVLPYISAGGGYMAYHTQVTGNGGYSYVDENGNLSSSKPSASKSFFIPVGLGARFNVATGVNIDLGYHLYFVNDKKFDGVYGTGRDDKFSSLNLGIEFALGNKQKPQLAVVNPAAQLAMDLWDRNEALKEELKASSEKNEEELQGVQQQIVDLQNLQKDSDGDGVPDAHDKCPNTEPGMRVDGAGCPLPQPKQIIKQEKVVVTQEDRKVVDEAIKNLEFDLGKATIRPNSYESLDRVAELLVNKNFSLKLAGHTDNTGSNSLNMRLSKDRAESVKSYLVSKGANPSRIEAVGYGDTQPIATNDTPEGRQQNRRVEFTLY